MTLLCREKSYFLFDKGGTSFTLIKKSLSIYPANTFILGLYYSTDLNTPLLCQYL